MATVLELKARLDALLSTAQRETADIDLFAPIPESEECPVCMIPLPYAAQGHEIVFHSCCGKSICSGCVYKNTLTEAKKGAQMHDLKCAFCRQPMVKNGMKELKKLMKKNVPEAFVQMAHEHKIGHRVLQSDTKALQMYIRAAELGNTEAYYKIGFFHDGGIAVEQDTPKAFEFYEVAAKKGSISAHKNLAILHERIKNNELCVKHVKVAASAGDQESMNSLMHMYTMYKDKILSKEELTQILRDFQSSQNEMKSKDRDDERMQRLKRDSRDHTSE